MTITVGPGITLGPGTSIVGGPSDWQTYWYTDFSTGTFEKTAGLATTGTETTGDVWFDQNSGTVTSADAFQGTFSYFLDSRTTASNRLRALVNRAVIDSYSEFKIEFQFKRTAADSFPTLLQLGGTSGIPFPSATNVFSLRWLAQTSAFGYSSAGAFVSATNPAWATVGDWNKIAAVYNNSTQTGQFVVNDVTVLGPALMQRGWANAQTSPNRIALSLFQYAYDASADNGIAGYLDNFGLYVK
jgi:hypothetical protein